MAYEGGLTRNQLISELGKSTHLDLDKYIPTFTKALAGDQEFLAHLIAWNRLNGQVRDSKIALPVITLSSPVFNNAEYVENSLAHMGKLTPREMGFALRFAYKIQTPGKLRAIRRMIAMYLRELESNYAKWERVAIRYRQELYSLYSDGRYGRVKPCGFAQDILFDRKYARGSVFEVIYQLRDMTPLRAANAIVEFRIPFLTACGVLQEKAKSPDILLALIERMSPTELVTNTKNLEKLGMKNNGALRSAFEKALGRASTSTKNVLKTNQAIQALDEDNPTAKQLKALQEKQLDKAASIEGDWLVMGDKSASMSESITAACELAAVLTRLVKGRVHLVFFDSSARGFEVTGKTLDEIKKLTRGIVAGGNTGIGYGLLWAIERQVPIDAIAIISDGGDNQTPRFQQVYASYSQSVGKQVPVYLYHVMGTDADRLTPGMADSGFDIQKFEVRGQDYYSLPNIAKTMNTKRFQLSDEIFATPLLTLAEVFPSAGKEKLAHA